MGWCVSFVVLFLGPPGLAGARSAAGEEKKPTVLADAGTEKITFAKHVAPFLSTYCTGCHGGAKPKGRLALDAYKDEASALRARDAWEKVFRRVREHEMPPPNRPQPKPEEIARVTRWAKDVLAANDCTGGKDPGRVTLRRLNRAEYNNTIRDLVGIRFEPAEDFPADDVGYGFDNIGDVLTLPPLLMEKYLAAAEKIVTLALADPAARGRLFLHQPGGEQTGEPYARKILEDFTRRAYRRPVFPGELDRLVSLVKLAESQGDSFEEGIKVALQAVLVSPHFLFRVERDRRPPNSLNTVQPVGDFELASRLSYFLWSSMPDEELFALAKNGTLRKDGNLEAQVRRMLKDRKSNALVENFASQWLQTRNLKALNPDPGRFPDFDEPLRSAMLKETELFFEAVMRENRSLVDFLDADFTFVNERLARHYGIPGVVGPEFRRVSLAGTPRGGVLTQATILMVTSNPTRTSPVKRGKWILENILGTPPPPPPPDAGELKEDKEVELTGTLRQRMEQHRANPNCATCHQRMDPLGFGFENFDAVGAWRLRDGPFPVDASGTLPDGRTFQGPRELKAMLKTRANEFSRCLTEKMLIYALGRGLEAHDRCTVDQVAGALAKDDHKFSTLVIEIVKSDPFQMRKVPRGDK
jgi:mono/diheme cytochrome c family protein